MFVDYASFIFRTVHLTNISKYGEAAVDLWNNCKLNTEMICDSSLVGTLSRGGDSCHLHTVLGRADGSTIAGHVVGDMVSANLWTLLTIICHAHFATLSYICLLARDKMYLQIKFS